ncbi:MAG: BON domain-containing protein [Acidobacteria bacterium]|nr:BON domain-containing protein [Acidobacteriota bacterium]
MTYKLLIAFTVAAGLTFAQPPDNTKRNQQDRSGSTETADKQSNAKHDLELTRMIRREITNDAQMSTYAKNVKIVAKDGKVTLRGPVNTQEEKMAIETIAKKHAGDASVENLIEVRAAKP